MKDLERVFKFVNDTAIPIEDTYIQSYRYMVDYFSGIEELKIGDVVVGAHMIYGWMPTILHLDKGNIDPQEVVGILQAVKDGKVELKVDELNTLKQYMNNSVVGTSKILHFVAPGQYPIWDSKIFKFTHDREPQGYLVNNVETYREYRSSLLLLTKHPKFPALQEFVNQELGYSVKGMRALELMMFLNKDR